MKSFRLKNKKGISEGGEKASLYKKAVVIFWKLSYRCSCYLKGAWSIAAKKVLDVTLLRVLFFYKWEPEYEPRSKSLIFGPRVVVTFEY
ncbi:hypothetical protein F2Q70_00030880 [Brassica cretica]|uniref:Uncharacterized protein n=1 Tax=Brassica cretica TaxID=69181 RepID=A0A8S9FKX5_BRACR|nr:hypothetical protein F2Q70_00030880 [Brassica cretica]